MKKYSFILFVLIFGVLISCIGEDIINDEVAPEVRILNAINNLKISENYQLNATFFNNIGQAEPAIINWSSSNVTAASIDANGLITGISEGQTFITAFVILENLTVEDTAAMNIVMDEVDQNNSSKSGEIMTTSSYKLQGSFTLSKIENSNNLLLSLAENYEASTSLPGLYVYLTNNPNSIANARSLGPVSVFKGAHNYTITNMGINDYSYLLYWCEPFGVKVGGGNIND